MCRAKFNSICQKLKNNVEIVNNISPNIGPCGTPHETMPKEDCAQCALRSTTICIWFVKYPSNNFSASGPILLCAARLQEVMCG